MPNTNKEWRAMTYRAEISEPSTTPLLCEDCGWSGTFAGAAEIKECSLTPGDPSPCGRCPECGILVYPEE